MMETCLENFRSIHSTIWEIWIKQVYTRGCPESLQEDPIVLQYGREEATRGNMIGKMGQKVIYSLGKVDVHHFRHSSTPSNLNSYSNSTPPYMKTNK